MAKKVFLSFRYADADLRNDLEGLFQSRGGKIEGTPVYCPRDPNAKTESEIRASVLSSMEGCRGLLMVPGDDAHSAGWIRYEVSVAESRGVPCAVVEHPASKGVRPEHRHLPKLRWDAQTIADHTRSW